MSINYTSEKPNDYFVDDLTSPYATAFDHYVKPLSIHINEFYHEKRIEK